MLTEDVVGLTSLIQHGQEAEVEPVVVSSRHRGGEIGQALLGHVIQEARKLGVLCLGVTILPLTNAAIGSTRLGSGSHASESASRQPICPAPGR